MIKKVNILVSGRVQGVFYRTSTKEKALELGINGWIMNKPDGSVYIEAEADESVLDQFIEWCKKGPMMARVDHINISHQSTEGFSNFEVRY